MNNGEANQILTRVGCRPLNGAKSGRSRSLPSDPKRWNERSCSQGVKGWADQNRKLHSEAEEEDRRGKKKTFRQYVIIRLFGRTLLRGAITATGSTPVNKATSEWAPRCSQARSWTVGPLIYDAHHGEICPSDIFRILSVIGPRERLILRPGKSK